MDMLPSVDYGAAQKSQEDEWRIWHYKILPCPNKRQHDWKRCPLAHEGEEVTRRDPRQYPYMPVVCEFRRQSAFCPRGETCPFTHNVFELWLHPDKYKTTMCRDGMSCRRRVCFFAHRPEELRTPSTQHQPQLQQPHVTVLAPGISTPRTVPGPAPVVMQPAPAPGTTLYTFTQPQQPQTVLVAQQPMMLQQPASYTLVPASSAAPAYPLNRPGRVMLPMQRSSAARPLAVAPAPAPARAMLQPQPGITYTSAPAILQQYPHASTTATINVQYLSEQMPVYESDAHSGGWDMHQYDSYVPAEPQYQYAPAASQQQQQQQWHAVQATSSSTQLPQLVVNPMTGQQQLLQALPDAGAAAAVPHYVSVAAAAGDSSAAGSPNSAGVQPSSAPKPGEDPELLTRLQALLSHMDHAVAAERGSLG